ncbi:MAG: hypothetical protein JSV79_12400, partial [Armatimonadota bacterium]
MDAFDRLAQSVSTPDDPFERLAGLEDAFSRLALPQTGVRRGFGLKWPWQRREAQARPFGYVGPAARVAVEEAGEERLRRLTPEDVAEIERQHAREVAKPGIPEGPQIAREKWEAAQQRRGIEELAAEHERVIAEATGGTPAEALKRGALEGLYAGAAVGFLPVAGGGGALAGPSAVASRLGLLGKWAQPISEGTWFAGTNILEASLEDAPWEERLKRGGWGFAIGFALPGLKPMLGEAAAGWGRAAKGFGEAFPLRPGEIGPMTAARRGISYLTEPLRPLTRPVELGLRRIAGMETPGSRLRDYVRQQELDAYLSIEAMGVQEGLIPRAVGDMRRRVRDELKAAMETEYTAKLAAREKVGPVSAAQRRELRQMVEEDAREILTRSFDVPAERVAEVYAEARRMGYGRLVMAQQRLRVLEARERELLVAGELAAARDTEVEVLTAQVRAERARGLRAELEEARA